MRAKYPNLTARQVIRRITETAHNPARGVDNQVGFGIVDPVAALTFDVAPGDAEPTERLSTDLYVPPPPPGPDLRPRHTALIGAAGVVLLAGIDRAVVAVRRRDVVKARTLGVRAALPAVVTGEVVALAAFVGLPPGRFGWWPAAVITAAAVLLLVITVYRRNAAGVGGGAWRAGGPGAANRSLRRQRRSTCRTATSCAGCAPTSTRPSPWSASPAGLRADIPARVDGVADHQRAAAGRVGRAARSARRCCSLAGIDVVSTGHRVRRGTGYPPLYSTLLADRPAAGQRETRLIVRLDIIELGAGDCRYRTSIGAAAAAATERIINALRQEGIRAAALSAAELDAALDG